MNIEFDMYQTLALAVLVLLLGSFLKKHIHFLEKFCIPAPVIGGLLFAILTCIGYSTGLADFTFDKSFDLTKLAYDVTRLSPLGIKVTIAEQPPSKTYT